MTPLLQLSTVERAAPLMRRHAGLQPYEAQALAFLLPLSDDYPNISSWYQDKVIPGLRLGSRTLLRIEREGQIVGLGIAKNECDEKKICTVRVSPEYAGRGMGLRIFDGLLRWLDVDRPHLTVSEGKLPLFERIFEYYRFEMTSVRSGPYVPRICEFGYNEIMLTHPPSQGHRDCSLAIAGTVYRRWSGTAKAEHPLSAGVTCCDD